MQFNKQLDSRLEQLNGIESLSGELSEELEAKAKHVESLNSLIQKYSKELEVKENEHIAIQISIQEKEREFDRIEKSISRDAEKLDLLEESVKLKFQEFQGMWKKFDEKELDLKAEKLKGLQKSINECEQKTKLEEGKLNSIQSSIEKCSNEFKLEEKQLLIVRKLKEKSCDSLQKSCGSVRILVDRFAHEIEMKERKFQSSVESREEVLESELEDIDLIDQKVNECLRKAEEKVKDAASLQRLVEERFHELEVKEREFERRVKEFKLSQQGLFGKSAELGFKEKSNVLHSVINIEQEQTPISLASHQSCIRKENDLFGLLNKHLESYDLVCREIFAVLQTSSTPDGLVLDAMQGICHLVSNRKDKEFDGTVIRSSVLLLGLLMKNFSKN
ncbi:hypothetical protein TorRG33x02_276870 [Trema orientale]|uniref:FRIGIDA-like protein n=1 Tax=Trema orientale TaxID=63057 RepID=A0A2P5CQ34_TREOI|nr:hypothetical protein TorRG33x02_276870 [Trema orientale]